MQEPELRLSKGDWVFHPRMPGWGYGKILELLGDNKGRVFFLLAGEKKMSWDHAGLVPIESDDASRAALNAQLAEFRLNLATDLLTTVQIDGAVTCTPCNSPGSRCELCRCPSEDLKSYSLERKVKMCICDACRNKIMLETGYTTTINESFARTKKRDKKEITDKVAKKKIRRK